MATRRVSERRDREAGYSAGDSSAWIGAARRRRQRAVRPVREAVAARRAAQVARGAPLARAGVGADLRVVRAEGRAAARAVEPRGAWQ